MSDGHDKTTVTHVYIRKVATNLENRGNWVNILMSNVFENNVRTHSWACRWSPILATSYG